MSGPVANAPSHRFLSRGVPTRFDRRAIETLSRRRDYLEGLRGSGIGGAYDERESAALSWALGLVAALRREGGLDGRARPVPEASQDL